VLFTNVGTIGAIINAIVNAIAGTLGGAITKGLLSYCWSLLYKLFIVTIY
jgi:hypothetical protein